MSTTDARNFNRVLHWVKESNEDAAMATANWLARDIDPGARSAIALLTRRDIALDQLRQAKSVFKTMRLVGETAADRRLGGRLYIAAIAAGIVVHDTRISRQSTAAIVRAMMNETHDPAVPAPLRQLADEALAKLASSYNTGVSDAPGGGQAGFQ